MKKVTLSIRKDQYELWDKVSKLHRISKSRMVQEFLDKRLPHLAKQNPIEIMGFSSEDK